MKWLGQNIWSFVSRFRNDVYLEDISNHGSDPDRFLTFDRITGKVTYRTGAEVLSDTGGGDITAVSFTTDDTTTITDSEGIASFTVAGGTGIDTSSAGSTVTIAGENASASNKGIASFSSAHFTCSSGAVTANVGAPSNGGTGLCTQDQVYDFIVARESKQYITGFGYADSSDMSGDDWLFPKDSKGVDYFDWDDLTDTVDNSSTSFTVPRASQHKGIVIPITGTIIGFYGAISSSSNHQGALSLWKWTPAWGVGGSTGVTATRTHYAAADLDGGSNYTNRPTKLFAMEGETANTDAPVAVTAGDMIIPALVCPVDGESTDLKCTFTIVLSTDTSGNY